MTDDAGTVLTGSTVPLVHRYDTALLDLDGVVYLQEEPVDFAAAALAAARDSGMRLEFVTNNASRRPDAVVTLLDKVGVPATVEEVVTSAQASAALLAEQLPAGSTVLVVGSDALADELIVCGLRPVSSADDRPVAVVQGFAASVGWAQLAEATVAINAGARWIATNNDSTVPSPRGRLPGNGALVAAVAAATGRQPDEIVGKPHPRLHAESVRRSGAVRPLVVGDRLDTDIEGAQNAGCDSLLVLTGVAHPADLLRAPAHWRPTYISADLRGLLEIHPEATVDSGGVHCGGWVARSESGIINLDGRGATIDALRALCHASWTATDDWDVIVAVSDHADAALSELELLGS